VAIIVTNRKKPYRAIIRIHRKQFSKSFARKVDAERWEREMLAKRDAGDLAPLATAGEDLTLDQLRERFEKEYAQYRQTPGTRLMEGRTYGMYLAPYLGQRKLASLTARDIRGVLSLLSGQLGISNGRVNRTRQILGCMLSQAVHWELIPFNPVTGIRKLPEADFAKQEAIQYLTQEEAARLLTWLQAHDPWLYPMVRTLLNTGIRFGEMAALRPRDLIRGSSGFYLQISRTYCKLSQQVQNRTKGKRSRMLPLGPGMSEFVASLARGRDPEGPLFWGAWSECRHPTKFRKRFIKALKGAGVRGVRIHDLRHTFAVHFLEGGGHLYDLQKLLGHQSMRLTERYSHFSLAMNERARGLVDHGAASGLTVVDGGKRVEVLPKRDTNAELSLRTKEKAPQGSVVRS